ncbi:hypothetical protein [Tenacibaculum sp. M341]|uniref:hypothetical protein n=1 Tax=Tenacibaculum sp. M341 TaxID=2530339 RepID=UPI001404E0D4|nr:hypothetical protein [Tenacibaculum sp. M341]
MKKSILNLGKALSKKQQESIKGGIGLCSDISVCPNINDRYCIVIGIGNCLVLG